MAKKKSGNCATGVVLVDSMRSRELLEELRKAEIRQRRIRNLAVVDKRIAEAGVEKMYAVEPSPCPDGAAGIAGVMAEYNRQRIHPPRSP
jgi:hypothetical protein